MQKEKKISTRPELSQSNHRAESSQFSQGPSPQNTKYCQTNPFCEFELCWNRNHLHKLCIKPKAKTNPFYMTTLPSRRLHPVKVDQGRSTGGREPPPIWWTVRSSR